jgi:hypothetical protein
MHDLRFQIRKTLLNHGPYAKLESSVVGIAADEEHNSVQASHLRTVLVTRIS